MGQPSPDFCLNMCTAWEPVFMKWASGESSEKGQEGALSPTSSWEAVLGSWPGAVATQPSKNTAGGARPSSCFTPSVAMRPAGT